MDPGKDLWWWLKEGKSQFLYLFRERWFLHFRTEYILLNNYKKYLFCLKYANVGLIILNFYQKIDLHFWRTCCRCISWLDWGDGHWLVNAQTSFGLRWFALDAVKSDKHPDGLRCWIRWDKWNFDCWWKNRRFWVLFSQLHFYIMKLFIIKGPKNSRKNQKTNFNWKS